MKSKLKVRAIELRKRGLSYSEISRKIPVAKSTLSLWLRNIKLSKAQLQRLKEKGSDTYRFANEAHRRYRIEKTRRIIKKAKGEIHHLDKRDLWLTGMALYWAEGAKQKEHRPSVGVIFSNSDSLMIKVYMKWLKICLRIPEDKIAFEIYIHETYKRKQKDLTRYWSEVTGFPVQRFDKIRLKKNKVKSYRKNRGNNYWGVLRIRIRKSTDLNRRITGWIEGVCVQCGMVQW